MECVLRTATAAGLPPFVGGVAVQAAMSAGTALMALMGHAAPVLKAFPHKRLALAQVGVADMVAGRMTIGHPREDTQPAISKNQRISLPVVYSVLALRAALQIVLGGGAHWLVAHRGHIPGYAAATTQQQRVSVRHLRATNARWQIMGCVMSPSTKRE